MNCARCGHEPLNHFDALSSTACRFCDCPAFVAPAVEAPDHETKLKRRMSQFLATNPPPKPLGTECTQRKWNDGHVEWTHDPLCANHEGCEALLADARFKAAVEAERLEEAVSLLAEIYLYMGPTKSADEERVWWPGFKTRLELALGRFARAALAESPITPIGTIENPIAPPAERTLEAIARDLLFQLDGSGYRYENEAALLENNVVFQEFRAFLSGVPAEERERTCPYCGPGPRMNDEGCCRRCGNVGVEARAKAFTLAEIEAAVLKSRRPIDVADDLRAILEGGE